MSYRKKSAVPSMNKVEGRVEKSCAGGNVLNFEGDVPRRSPGGDRSYIGDFEQGATTGSIAALDAPISSALNLK